MVKKTSQQFEKSVIKVYNQELNKLDQLTQVARFQLIGA